MTCITLTSLLQNDLHLYHTQTSLSRGSPSDFFSHVIDNPFYKNSPALLFIDPKVSGFSWCFKDSNKVLPSFPKSVCCGKSISSDKQAAAPACFLLCLLGTETLSSGEESTQCWWKLHFYLALLHQAIAGRTSRHLQIISWNIFTGQSILLAVCGLQCISTGSRKTISKQLVKIEMALPRWGSGPFLLWK